MTVNQKVNGVERKDTAYLRTLTQNTGDNPQDRGDDEAGESSEYESFEDEILEKNNAEEDAKL